ncbi:MAG TPA: hypothetical protein VHK65_03195 [Candidatus Dormibacteraeota bacterium]|nr:hypothetical protein [Candidatus Dormibacteraeota bacterium]
MAYVGMAAATASALVGLQSGVAFAADAITVTAGSDTAITVLEGDSTGSKQVATFTDSGNPPIVIGAAPRISCDGVAQARYSATIDWSGDGTVTGAGTVRCTDTEGTWAVWGAHTYPDSGTFHINVTVTDTADTPHVSGSATNTAAVTVADAALSWDGDNSTRGTYSAVEGKSITVAVDFFEDRNSESSARDTSITGTIDWGDGTALQTVQSTAPSDICECSSNDAEVSASHVYDAGSPAGTSYLIKVTAKDDGGATSTRTFDASISDGKLTADANKSLTATASAAFTSVLGSFTDEAGAQAAAGDFSAMISWGDNALYPGTVTKTASGAFSVSGTHTYASAGSKSITATVTDHEGSTVMLHATVTVGAAPIVLPATGQPHPTQPAVPVIPLALLILSLASLAVGGRILAKMPR